MAQIIQIKDTPVLIDVDWLTLPDATRERAKETKRNIKDFASTHTLKINRKSLPPLLGLAAVSSDQQKTPKPTPSGAAWIAEALGDAQNLVCLHQLEHDRCWLAIIENGAPKPNGDKIIQPHEVDERIHELIGEAPQNYRFISDVAGVESLTDSIEWSFLDFNELFAKLAKPPRSARMVPIGVSSSAIWLGLLLIVVIGGLMGWDQYREYQRREEAKRLAAERAKNPPIPPDVQYLTAFKSQFNGQPRVHAQTFVKAAWQRVNTIPLKSRGWEITEITCNPLECVAKFKRNRLAGDISPSDLAADTLERRQNEATAHYGIKLANLLTIKDTVKPTELPLAFPDTQFMAQMIPYAEMLSDLGVTLNNEVQQPLTLAAGSPLLVKESKWTLTGNHLVLPAQERLPRNFLGQELKVTGLPGNVQLSLKGNNYAASHSGIPTQPATPAQAAPGQAVPAPLPPAAPKN